MGDPVQSPPTFKHPSEDVVAGFWPQTLVDMGQEQFHAHPYEHSRYPDETQSVPLTLFSIGHQEFDGHPSKHPRYSDKPRLIERRPPPSSNPLQNNRGVNTLFYKTRLCGKFIQGCCPYGDNCSFAHGPGELRAPPINWQGIVEGQRLEEDLNEQRTRNQRNCRKFHSREGERSGFQYERPELFRESSAISVATAIVSSGRDGDGSHKRAGSWKTKICYKWEATGHCPFGENCHFAHGFAELSKPGSHVEFSSMKIGSAHSKRLPCPDDDPPSNTDLTCKHEARKKNYIKWKDPKKISRIYGDWIDGPLIGSISPNKADD